MCNILNHFFFFFVLKSARKLFFFLYFLSYYKIDSLNMHLNLNKRYSIHSSSHIVLQKGKKRKEKKKKLKTFIENLI